MSQRGIDFLQSWIRQHVDTATHRPLYDTRAKVLAEQCAADARSDEAMGSSVNVRLAHAAATTPSAATANMTVQMALISGFTPRRISE